MAWALAECCVVALPCSSLSLYIKVKSDTEKNCAVLLLWVFVKFQHSLDFSTKHTGIAVPVSCIK